MGIKYLRSFRIWGVALFDLISAFIGTIVVFVLLRKKNIPVSHYVIAALVLTIPIGIVAHVLFRVNTTLNYKLGLSDRPS